jgi:hypothetical protein
MHVASALSEATAQHPLPQPQRTAAVVDWRDECSLCRCAGLELGLFVTSLDLCQEKAQASIVHES